MFYLSSRGSAASGWIANALSIHPKIVCFQSSRSFPPLKPSETYPLHDWIMEIPPEKYVESLKICEESVRGLKKFGSIHGYHNLLAKKYIDENNGFFGYIIRNPLERIHSCLIYNLFNNYYTKILPKLKNEDVFEHIIQKTKNITEYSQYLNYNRTKKKNNDFKQKLKKPIYNLLDSYVPKIIQYNKINKKYKQVGVRYSVNTDEVNVIFDEFARLCNDFMSKDSQLYNGCDLDNGIKMEELMKSKVYFRDKLVKRIIDDENISDEYLNLVYSLRKDKIGIHRKDPIDSKNIWNKLPKSLKEIFNHYYNYYDIKKIVKNFDYDYKFYI